MEALRVQAFGQQVVPFRREGQSELGNMKGFLWQIGLGDQRWQIWRRIRREIVVFLNDVDVGQRPDCVPVLHGVTLQADCDQVLPYIDAAQIVGTPFEPELVEQLPGKKILGVTPAGDKIAQPVLGEFSCGRVGPELAHVSELAPRRSCTTSASGETLG